MARTKGWRNEPARHALAAKGIRTRKLKQGQVVVKTSDSPEYKMRALKQEVEEAVREAIDGYIKDHPDESRSNVEDRINDDGTITEIYDSSVPIYNSEIMDLGALPEVFGHENELGPAFDGSPTPVNIVAGSLYEILEETAFEETRNYLDQLEEDGKFNH